MKRSTTNAPKAAVHSGRRARPSRTRRLLVALTVLLGTIAATASFGALPANAAPSSAPAVEAPASKASVAAPMLAAAGGRIVCQSYSYGTSCTGTGTIEFRCKAPKTVTTWVKDKVWEKVWDAARFVFVYVEKIKYVKKVTSILEWQTCVRVKTYSCFTSQTYGGWCDPYK
ncbi:MAG: hypothetical protein AAGD35_10395 [Actinomycetota bacterium]